MTYTARQERELEKVNAFYLQKEAEVSLSLAGRNSDKAHHRVAQIAPQDLVGQEEGDASKELDCLQDLSKLHHT